ncbi:hypothetical protein V500_02779 [Pseudogymnoascus sp. VKM F-4518 (FW-2643)]|nr:hypothetical protein V500_02779 [Pseudogymnoascus sp. VKM F-4518 (FW-2643)]
MDLSNFVHVKKTRHPLTAVYLSEDQFVPQKYQTQQYPEGYFNDNGFSAQMSDPYSQQAQSYAYLQVPQPPPSPPVEEILKCSLPSISNLLRIADNNPTQQQEQAQQRSQQTPDDRSHPQYGLSTSYTMMPAPPTMSNYDPTLAGNLQISDNVCSSLLDEVLRSLLNM